MYWVICQTAEYFLHGLARCGTANPPECITSGASAVEHEPTTILSQTDRAHLTMRPATIHL